MGSLKKIRIRYLDLNCTGLPYKTSTDSLLKASKDLSVQQLTALQTLVSVHKIKKKGKPEYLNEKLKLNESVENVVTPRRQVRKIYVDQKLTLTRAGFIYRGGLLWNQLPINLRLEMDTPKFRKGTKKWVELNVPVKPG